MHTHITYITYIHTNPHTVITHIHNLLAYSAQLADIHSQTYIHKSYAHIAIIQYIHNIHTPYIHNITYRHSVL